MRTLVSASQKLLNERPLKLIENLIFLQYNLYRKNRLKEEEAKRNLTVKIFQVSSHEDNCIVGIAVGLNLLNPYELLEEKNIYRALVSLLPGIELISDSFYSCTDKSKSFLFCYLEIKKLRGKNLTRKDTNLLKQKLPSELRHSIQTLTFSLLFSNNEEEIYKNTVQLAKELKTKDDIPQVIIYFQNHIQGLLSYSVVLVRVRKKNDPDIRNNISLPSSTTMTVQKVISFGPLSNDSIKEGIIFSLEIDHSLFLRKNWSVDLNLARNYIVKIIEQIFGPFRDYNGGLLFLQNKQIEEIKNTLRFKHEEFSPLISDLFCFNPPSFQAFISTPLSQKIFSHFMNFMKKNSFEQEFMLEEKREESFIVVFLKTSEIKHLKVLIDEIKNLQKEVSSTIGYSSFEFEKKHYLCMLGLSPSSNFDFKAHFEDAIKNQVDVLNLHSTSKVLRINFQEGDPPSLNPQIAIDQRCRCLQRGLFEGLTRLNHKGNPEPAGAVKITISPCQKIYTISLREHFWSNGEKVSAFDYEQTWKNAIIPDSNCLRPDLFYIIKNARSVHLGLKPLNEVKIKALDASTLVVELEYPAFYFLYLLSQPIFGPIYKGEQEPYYFNGPFLLKEWKRNQSLRLTANPYYWDKKNVKLEEIVISMHKEVHLLGKLYEAGELDWIGEPFNTSSPHSFQLEKKKRWATKKVDQFYWIYLNIRSLPFTSNNIRKALACSINRQELKRLLKVNPYVFNDDKTHWDGNADLARIFFTQGLKDLNIAQNAFPAITLHWSFEGEKHVVELIKKQIEEVLGIKVNLKRLPWNQLSLLLDRREFQCSTCYRSAPYGYSRSYLELFREISNLYNSSQWENEKFKQYINKALKSLNIDSRDNFLNQAEHIFLEEMPVIPVFLPEYKYLLSDSIKKIAIAPNGDIDLKKISKKEKSNEP